MKKLTAFIIGIIILNFSFSTAYAEDVRFSRVMNEGVVLYMDSSLTTAWFTLPVGYYVKILSIGSSAIKVEYKEGITGKPSVKGYLSIEDMYLCDVTPQTAYPSLVLTVNQTCLLYKDVDFSFTETIPQNSTMDFYGIFEKTDGQKFVYGYLTTTAGDKYVGYLPVGVFNGFTIPSLPIENPSESVPSFIESSNNGMANNNLGDSLQLIIIIAVSLVAISIVYVLFRPSKPKSRDEVITLNEFSDE